MKRMEKKRLRILIVAHHLNVRGGIPYAATALANAMCHKGHEIILLTHADSRSPAYALDSRLSVQYYAFSDKNSEIQKLRRHVKRMDPDLCIAMFCGGPHLVWAITLMGTGIPYVLSEHCDPCGVETRGWWSPAGRRAGMCGADLIHLLLPQYISSVPEFLQERIRFISNPLEYPDGTADAAGYGLQRLRLLWLGRLDDDVKQCTLALDAFALLAAAFPSWDMHVVGDGKDAEYIHRHSESLCLNERIFFHGDSPNPWQWYLGAHVFCMSSVTEGFGLTTAEALGCALPVAGFAACPGTAHLVRHGHNGLLAEAVSAQALADQLAKLMGDAGLRRQLGHNALEIRNAYNADEIYEQWEQLCLEAANCKGHTVMDDFSREPFASMARLSAAARREYVYRDFGMPMPSY